MGHEFELGSFEMINHDADPTMSGAGGLSEFAVKAEPGENEAGLFANSPIPSNEGKLPIWYGALWVGWLGLFGRYVC